MDEHMIAPKPTPKPEVFDSAKSGKSKKQRQRKGSGSVRLRGKVWYIAYHIGGRRVEVATSATTKRGATDLLADAIATAKQTPGATRGRGAERAALPKEARARTLVDGKALIEASFGLKENRSLDRMLQAYAHLEAYFGDKLLAQILSGDCAEYCEARRLEVATANGKIGNGTLRYELSILRRILNLAYNNHYIDQVPKIELPPEATPRQGFFEVDAFVAVLAELPVALRNPLRFALMTGWRFNSEILGLKWSQVDFTRGHVTLTKAETKEKFDRVFPFRKFPKLRALLQEQRELTDAFEADHPSDRVLWVFHNQGARLSKNYHDAWDRACERAGHPDKLVHDLRRTTTRNLAKAGVATPTAMRLVGHRTMSTHLRYQIVEQPDLATGVAALALGPDALRLAELDEPSESPEGSAAATGDGPAT